MLTAVQPDGEFEGWRLATVDELRRFFADFTGTVDGHSSDPRIERKLQRLLGGPLDEAANVSTGWHRWDTSGFVGNPIGPNVNGNGLIDYHMGYIGEDSE